MALEIELDLEWDDDFDQAWASLEVEVTQVIQGISFQAWARILQNTPQFYGRMAASWTYSLNAPQFADRSKAVGTAESHGHHHFQVWLKGHQNEEDERFGGLHKGHREAIGIANFANAGNDVGFELGDTIWFANGVDHGEGPYSEKVEEGEVRLRPENRPAHFVKRTLDAMQSLYGNDVTPRRAEILKSLKLEA